MVDAGFDVRPAGSTGNANLFDPRYAIAVTGDTVTMIAWTRSSADATLCTAARESLPTYKAVVIAVAGRVVILGDVRDSIVKSLTNGNDKAWLQRVADIADPVLIPTMRSVFDPDFHPPSTAGGRYMVLMSSMPTAIGYAYDGLGPYGTGAVPGVCPNSSDVITTRISSEAWGRLPETATFRVKALAATIIHEYAHNVDSRMHHAAGRALSAAPSGMLSEAWASLAEETATRIALGQPTNAQHSLITDFTPDNGMGLMGMWGVFSNEGPWGSEGRYTLSPQVLLFAREAAGEASVEHNRRPTFYQRLNVNPPNIADRPAHARAVAAQAGMTIDSLVDMHALASATTGLVRPDVYQQRPLPRFTSWDMSDVAIATGPYSATFSGRVPRHGRQDVNLTAAAGGFAAAYLMADQLGVRGLSLRVESVGPSRKVVRLTRLR